MIVVDDASTDGTAAAVRAGFPDVQVIRLPRSEGACARNIGVATADTDLVAFADDDSWYEPGALDLAAEHLQADPDVGLLAARCIVEPFGTVDPVSEAQAVGALGVAPPGPSILGFLACTAIVRRDAFLGVGGFHPVLGFMGEEQLLALDLRAAGWRLVHVPEVVAHHHPGQVITPRPSRDVAQLRNHVLTMWLRRPLSVALGATVALVRAAPTDADRRRALAGVARRLPAALSDRRPVPADVEADIRTLESSPC